VITLFARKEEYNDKQQRKTLSLVTAQELKYMWSKSYYPWKRIPETHKVLNTVSKMV